MGSLEPLADFGGGWHGNGMGYGILEGGGFWEARDLVSDRQLLQCFYAVSNMRTDLRVQS